MESTVRPESPGSSSSSSPGDDPSPVLSRLDPEVRPRRRRFTADDKLRVLREADRCKERGSIGALLRREGIYSSLLVRWRQERNERARTHLDKKRGPKPQMVNPLAGEVHRLQKELARTQARLHKAELVIDLQKKAAKLLGEPYLPDEIGDID